MLLAKAGYEASRRAMVPAAALLAIISGTIATSPGTAGALIAAIADPLAVLAARSPGARSSGALTQSKLRRAAADRPRTARRLPHQLHGPATPAGADTFAGPADVISVPDAGPVGVGPVEDVAFAAPPGGSGFIGGGGGVIGGGIGGIGGGGIGGGGGGTAAIGGPTGDTPAVPEPASWLTMLLGLGVIGMVMRRRAAGIVEGAQA